MRYSHAQNALWLTDCLRMNRRVLFTLIKLLVVGAAVFWLSRRVDIAGVSRVLRGANLSSLGLALALGLVPVLISGVRWHALLRVLDIHIPVRALACVAQIGQFFAVLMPGVAGDDGTRFFYISRLAPGRVRQACSTVLLDRGLGFASLFILTSICIPLNWELLGKQESTRWLSIGFLGVGGCVLGAVALFFLLSQNRLEWTFGLVQKRFGASKLLSELVQVASAFAGNRRVLMGVGAAALGTQVLICCMFWAVGRAVGIPLPLVTWMGFVPVIVMAGVLPITFAGIGVRDYLLFLFIGSGAGLSTGADQIAALSLLLLLLTLIAAALGGLVYLGYKPPQKGETERSLAEVQ